MFILLVDIEMHQNNDYYYYYCCYTFYTYKCAGVIPLCIEGSLRKCLENYKSKIVHHLHG